MFFKKKKTKLDAKVRFQHKQFTTKLGSARTYRRTAAAVPDSRLQKRLTKVGLGSRWSQIGVGLIILTALYIAYFPNVLTLQSIHITGLTETQARDLEIEIRNQIANSNIFMAQRNMLFFSPKLVIAAAEKVDSINAVGSIKKNYQTKTLQVAAESKYEKYLVAAPDKVFDVYNDGSLKAESGVRRGDWSALDNPNMLKVQFGSSFTPEPGQLIFESSLRDYIDLLNERLKSIENLKVAFYGFKEEEEQPVRLQLEQETPEEANHEVSDTEPAEPEEPELRLPFNSSEVHVSVYKGADRRRTFRVVFDSTRDSALSVADLKLLLSQTAPERFDQLAYIDMRIEGKAFLCLLNAPCRK